MMLETRKKISGLGEVSVRIGMAFFYLLLLTTPFIMEGCDDESPKPTPTATIASVAPLYALPSATITITGTNFNLKPDKNIVRFNGIPATVITASATQLTVTLPTEASSGKVTVTVNNLSTAFSSEDFEVLKDIPRNGLVAFYPFNGNANDISGNNLNGVLGLATASPVLDFDHFGNNSHAYSFDGVNDYISLGNPTLLQINNKLSISFWIKSMATAGYAITKASGILGPNFEKGYTIYKGNSNFSNFHGFFGSSVDVNLLAVSSTITTGIWQHIVVVLSDKNLKMFINGIEVAEKTSTKSENLLTDGSGGNLNIGALIDSFGNGSYFKGCIDNIAIYNNALTSDEIIKLYSETITKY